MTQATMDVRQTLLANQNFAPVEVSPTSSSSPTGGFLSRPHVLEAAAKCFEELGYDGLTIRAIAGRLGCSVGSIYRYFTDKRELLLACCSQVLEPVADALENENLSFNASVSRYIEQARAMSEQYRLMFWLCGDPRKLPVTGRILASWAALLGDADAARARWAMLHGLLVIGEDDAVIAQAVTTRIGSTLPPPPLPAPAPVPAPVAVSAGEPTRIVREPSNFVPTEPADVEDVTLL